MFLNQSLLSSHNFWKRKSQKHPEQIGVKIIIRFKQTNCIELYFLTIIPLHQQDSAHVILSFTQTSKAEHWEIYKVGCKNLRNTTF